MADNEKCLKHIDKTKEKIAENKKKGITLEEEILGRRKAKKDDSIDDEDSINEYQISDFMKSEWNTLAKISSKLK